MWKRQHEMPGCRQCSKNNLRLDKQIQVKMQKEQIGWGGTKKIRWTVKGKKAKTEESFRMNTTRRLWMDSYYEKEKMWSQTFIEIHAICRLFPGHRFCFDLQFLRRVGHSSVPDCLLWRILLSGWPNDHLAAHTISFLCAFFYLLPVKHHCKIS